MSPLSYRKKRYRRNVAAVILSPDYPERCKFFVGKSLGIKNRWQFPQGGIDGNETPVKALFRELKEEIGCDDVEILGEFPHWITSDFPKIKRAQKRYPFDGQTQKYFLVRLKDETKIDLNAFSVPEFDDYDFVEYNEVFKRASYFKKQVYRRVINYFIKEGYIEYVVGS